MRPNLFLHEHGQISCSCKIAGCLDTLRRITECVIKSVGANKKAVLVLHSLYVVLLHVCNVGGEGALNQLVAGHTLQSDLHTPKAHRCSVKTTMDVIIFR